MTPGDDDEHDDARTLVRWTERRGRPLSHPHRHTVARHDASLAEGTDDSLAVSALGTGDLGSALATTRIERIEQAALLVHCRKAPAGAAPTEAAPAEPAHDQATVPLVVPIDTPATAPMTVAPQPAPMTVAPPTAPMRVAPATALSWPLPRTPSPLPAPAPPVARDPTPVPRPVPGRAAPRRRRWRALAVVIVIAVSGAAGYEVAVHAGETILAHLR